MSIVLDFSREMGCPCQVLSLGDESVDALRKGGGGGGGGVTTVGIFAFPANSGDKIDRNFLLFSSTGSCFE